MIINIEKPNEKSIEYGFIVSFYDATTDISENYLIISDGGYPIAINLEKSVVSFDEATDLDDLLISILSQVCYTDYKIFKSNEISIDLKENIT